METIYDYVKNYGKYSFLEKDFTEVDNLILSLVSYVDFRGIVPRIGAGSIKLKDASKIYFEKYNKKDINRYAFAVRRATFLLKDLAKSNRYKDLDLLNYKYVIDDDVQFGAVCIKLPNRKMYVSFEGTDGYVSGWKEDFMMASRFPLKAHKEAIRYLNMVVHFFGPKIYVGGHSKGGNLALVSSMYCRNYVYNKIINIYSNDGPGLRFEELSSDRYNKVKDKYIHIIPEECLVGILFRNEDNYLIVKSNNRLILQHDATSWLVNGDKFALGTMSKFTIRCRKALGDWLDKMTYEKREKFIMNLFSIFDKAGIYDFMELRNSKLKMLYKIYKEAKNIDKESEKMLSTCFKDLYLEWRK